jgi:hypothetical protein
MNERSTQGRERLLAQFCIVSRVLKAEDGRALPTFVRTPVAGFTAIFPDNHLVISGAQNHVILGEQSKTQDCLQWWG